MVIQKSISKRISIIIIVILVIELAVFAFWYTSQPSYKSTILTTVQRHESKDQSYYFVSLSNQNASLDSIYNAVSIYSVFNEMNRINVNNVTNYILSKWNSTTGLFVENGTSSIRGTFDAVSTLSILGKTASLNKNAIINGVLKLQTNDSLFRDYVDENVSIITGEVDHLYEAINTLNLLAPNITTIVNGTQILLSMASLQDANGGIHESVSYSPSESTPTLRDTYYFTQTYDILNKTNYSNNTYLRLNDLENWINGLYTTDGFKMQSGSQPSVEATAYAILSLSNVGMSSSTIQKLYPYSFNSIIKYLDTNFMSDTTHNTLDILNDILLSLTRINQLSRLNNPYFDQQSQFFFTTTIALTILAFIVNTVINLFFALKEDDSKYYEGKLHTVIEKIIEDDNNDYSELSLLLGEEIYSIEQQPNEEDDKLALLTAMGNEYTFIITYETFNGLAKKVEKFSNTTDELLSVLDFLESDIFFTIDEGISHLKNNNMSTYD